MSDRVLIIRHAVPAEVRVSSVEPPLLRVGGPTTVYNTISMGEWIYYASTWTIPPILVASIPDGDVYQYELNGVVRFRLVPSPYDATLDSFFSNFDGSSLSGLIKARGA